MVFIQIRTDILLVLNLGPNAIPADKEREGNLGNRLYRNESCKAYHKMM